MILVILCFDFSVFGKFAAILYSRWRFFQMKKVFFPKKMRIFLEKNGDL